MRSVARNCWTNLMFWAGTLSVCALSEHVTAAEDLRLQAAPVATALCMAPMSSSMA